MTVLKYIFKVFIRIITLLLLIILSVLQLIWIILCPIVYIIGYIFYYKVEKEGIRYDELSTCKCDHSGLSGGNVWKVSGSRITRNWKLF